MVGLVKAPLKTTVIQVSSRLFITFGICALVSDKMQEPIQTCFYLSMILAWSITEIIRYPYYIFSLLDERAPSFWLWMRYSFFYVLYPVGATSEWLLLWMAYTKKGSVLSMLRYDMPNRINMIFDYRHLILIVMLTYFFAFPAQYNYMIAQRKKYLKGNPLMFKPKSN